MNIKEILGSKIKEQRKKRKISQEKFAELIDMTPRQIVRIEQGESFPTAENIEKIASVLGLLPQDLFFCEVENSDEFYRQEIRKIVESLDTKNLKLTYSIIKNF